MVVLSIFSLLACLLAFAFVVVVVVVRGAGGRREGGGGLCVSSTSKQHAVCVKIAVSSSRDESARGQTFPAPTLSV